MFDTYIKSKRDVTSPARLVVLLVAALILAAAAGPAGADSPKSLAETMTAREESGPIEAEVRSDASGTVTPSAQLADTWGVEVASIRLTANNHMIDYRYKVLDAGKATDLFKRQIKPYMIHQESGRVLAVPETAKLGPLRNSNTPQNDRIYWMFFGNADYLVKAGDKVTVVIGDYRVEDLVVE